MSSDRETTLREVVATAEQIARETHQHQVDKAGRPYIEHVERDEFHECIECGIGPCDCAANPCKTCGQCVDEFAAEHAALCGLPRTSHVE